MTADNRFAPPPVPDLPSDIVERKATSTGEVSLVAVPKRRKPLRYRRPLNTPLVIWLFAFVGVAAVVIGLAKATRQVVLAPPDLSALKHAVEKPTHWTPVNAQDGVAKDGILIQLDVTPANATVLVDGTPASSNPVFLQRTQQLHSIVVAAPGYQSQTFERRADKPHTLKVKLLKTP